MADNYRKQKMSYTIEFDIAAIIFLILLICNCLNQKRFSTRTSKACMVLIADVLISTILNLTTSFCLTYRYESYLLNTCLGYLQGMIANLGPMLYYIFIHMITHQFRRINKRFWILMLAIIVIETICILSTPFTHFLFLYGPSQPYTHSYGYFGLYAVGLVFITAILIELIKYRNQINKGSIFSLLLFCFLSLFAVGIQMYFPNLQITGFATTVAVVAAFLTIQNPGLFYDQSTGTLNKVAFIEKLSSFNPKKPGSLIVFKLAKTNKIKDLFGIEGRYYITRQFMNTLQNEFKNARIFYLFNDTYIILFKKIGEAEAAGNRIYELTNQSMNFYPVEGSSTIINYRISGRIHIINNTGLIMHSNTSSDFYTTDETISLINYIATSWTPHHVAFVDYNIIQQFQEQIRVKHIVEEAIKNESFEVFMQPIFSLKENSFTGAEALLRLKNTDGTYIPPLQFIPEAEANGDIIQISDIMIQKTCDFINKTNLFDKGIQSININLSMIQCMYEGIIDHICEILNRNHISPTLIRFEITESVAANDEIRFTRLLEEMSSRGIEYALDDFGTGYSNTSKILNHNFSEIKFDKSLIDTMTSDGENENAIRYLFDLAKEKKMVSLAEGVETKENVERLKKIGCDLIQGFYYAYPMPADEFMNFLEEHN